MKTFIISLFLCIFSFCSIASAADLPRIMIMGEDSDPDTIPRSSRVFKRVQNAITNELLQQGFDVKDETALTLDTHVQGRQRRVDSELIQIAKDAGTDVVVLFSIYPRVKTNANSVRVKSRVEGRLMEVYSGSRMGNFEVDPDVFKLVPKPYNRNDILEAIGSISKTVGREVGAVLADRLSQYVDQPEGRLLEWDFVFDGFTDREMMDMEEILIIFSGYDSHQPKKNAFNTSTHHEYLYKSSIDSAKMKRNMVKMLDKLNLQGRVYISGNSVKVQKQNKVRQRRKAESSEW